MVFSRNDRANNEVRDLAPVLSENIRMLSSVLPSSIRVSLECEPDLPRVVIDVVQMQQIMMNLCLNAKDAMTSVGDLVIRLAMQRDLNNECNACHQQVNRRTGWPCQYVIQERV